jgi:hypothetical protein
MAYIVPNVVRALPVRPCRWAAWQTLVATINGIIFLYLLSLLSGVFTFLPEGVDLVS